MAYEEWNREIPLEEQLREVSNILAAGLLRRYRHAPSPTAPGDVPPKTRRPPKGAAVARPNTNAKPAVVRGPLRTLLTKRSRQSGRELFWQEKVRSMTVASPGELARAVRHADRSLADIDSRDAFDYVLGELPSEDHKIARLVGEQGLRRTARQLGTSWRQIGNALARMRPVFVDAGFS